MKKRSDEDEEEDREEEGDEESQPKSKGTAKKPAKKGMTRVDLYKKRQEQSAIVGYIKLLVLMCFLGAVFGLGFIFRDRLAAWLNPPAPQVVQAPPPAPPELKVEPPPPPPKVEQVKVEKKPEVVKVEPEKPKKPEREVVEAEEQRALKLLDEGRKLVADFSFTKAGAKFDEAAKLRAKLETHNDAELWKNKAEQYDLGTRHITVSDFAKLETTHRLKLETGSELNGVKLSETNDGIEFRKFSDNPASSGSIKATFPTSAVTEVVEVPQAERQKEFRAMLTQLEAASNISTDAVAGDYYDLIFLSRRLNLNKECLAFLEQAYPRAKGGKLGDALRNVVVDRTIDRATIMALAKRKQGAEVICSEMITNLSKWEPAVDAVAEFKSKVLSQIKDDFKPTISFAKKKADPEKKKEEPKTAKQLAQGATAGKDEGEEMFVDSTGVKSQNAANQSKVDEANKKYEEGMACYRNFQQGVGSSNKVNNANLEKALHLLEKAVDLYGEVLDKEKSNATIENRQLEANMIVYACRKYHTLN